MEGLLAAPLQRHPFALPVLAGPELDKESELRAFAPYQPQSQRLRQLLPLKHEHGHPPLHAELVERAVKQHLLVKELQFPQRETAAQLPPLMPPPLEVYALQDAVAEEVLPALVKKLVQPKEESPSLYLHPRLLRPQQPERLVEPLELEWRVDAYLLQIKHPHELLTAPLAEVEGVRRARRVQILQVRRELPHLEEDKAEEQGYLLRRALLLALCFGGAA